MKIERKPHTTVWIPIEDLSVIWVQAQRPFDEAWARKIADEFDPDYFGTISVTLPNGEGKYHIIDGQHRTYGAELALGQGQKLPCNIFPAEDPARAAAIFDKINTNRKSPRALDRFKVRVTAGYENEVAVDRIVRGLGYQIAPGPEQGNLRAVGACMFVYERFSGDILESALKLLQATWGKDATGVDAALIRGYGAFLHRYPEANWGRLVDRASKNKAETAQPFLGHARTIRDMRGSSLTDGVIFVLLERYNRGLKNNRLGQSEVD